MPIYEFRCEQCKSVFEQILSIHARGRRACPSCGTPSRRLVSRSSFQLKGSGWYVTDYKRSAAGKNGGDSPGSGTAGTTGATGS